MFRQLFKYRLIGTLRVWQILFWNLVFPLALSTFLYLAMSSIMYPDPLEALSIQADNALVADVLKDVEFEGVKMYTLEEKADPRQAVADGTLRMYVPDESPPVIVAQKRGVDAETLSSILISVDRAMQAVGEIMQTDPTADPAAIVEEVASPTSIFTDSGEDSKLLMTNFFYTVLAMVCLGAITLGVVNVYETEAQSSSMGKRLGIAPHNKRTFLIPFTVASLLFNLLYAGVALLYINFVLGIPFGENIPAVLATIVVGSLFGLSIGMVIGLLVKGSLDVRMNVGIGLYVFSSFLAGMMSLDVKQLITLYVPIVHKINPSSLITNTFSSLYYFEDLTVFRENLLIMGAMTLVFLGIVWFLTRRNQYEYV